MITINKNISQERLTIKKKEQKTITINKKGAK